MFVRILNFRHSLAAKVIFGVGLILVLSSSGWAFFALRSQKQKTLATIVESTDRLTHTIRLGTHYAMMFNSRDDITQIINNIAKLEEIQNIRIFNKSGQIKFSNRPAEVEQVTNIKDEACYICHRSDPPLVKTDLAQRTRIFTGPAGHRALGIITPIYNEPSCITDCHVHPEDKQVLGALDVVVSLEKSDLELAATQRRIVSFALSVFLGTAAFITILFVKFVNQPVGKLISGTRRIVEGRYPEDIDVDRTDEIGQLARAVMEMGQKIRAKETELNHQRSEYQELFERVPCFVTVQNRDYQLIGYNREFSQRFAPDMGDFCYHAYKNRTSKCKDCPVEKTFTDGQSHQSYETGVGKDGLPSYWLVKTAPIKNDQGEVVAAMEMSLDITQERRLEQELKESEENYHAVFNNIPSPIFVLDRNNYHILDCNDRVKAIYGYGYREIIGTSFMDLFREEERADYRMQIVPDTVINQAIHLNHGGQTIYVSIRFARSQYNGRNVILAIASDITARLEAEQQLIQASKMATLGEMATGVAHELNQPLAVIKTASSFFMRKVRRKEPIKETILGEMAAEIDSHVDRAANIINHMRQFGRKPELKTEPVDVNRVLKSAFNFFSQQLKVRGIDVVWDTAGQLPPIMAEPDRLEQVFINLLINARDAIEEQEPLPPGSGAPRGNARKITLKTWAREKGVRIEVCDSGCGISAALIDKVFEPFFTTKRVGKGTGLGLSISYGIVKDYGGTISARSQPGEGTCFTIDFPLSAEDHGEDPTGG